ncbi:hypothetical protein AB0D12_40000 [Streptomyces sp. NPDC048479]|uniref:hypothetical protein n=1 Tax=Streptomyces sp. NPDC048479 TaxID=3154725 RepID=UPI003437F99E
MTPPTAPEPGWVFVHLPMNQCTGRADRCTVDRITDDRVIWHVGDDPDDPAAAYSTPLAKFAHAVARGEYFTAPAA